MAHEVSIPLDPDQTGLAVVAQLIAAGGAVAAAVDLEESDGTPGYYSNPDDLVGLAAGTYAVRFLDGPELLGTGSLHWTGAAEADGPAGDYPVTVAEARAHLRLDPDGGQDGNLELLVAAATDYAEELMGATLLQRERTAVLYEGRSLPLPRGPLVSVTSATDADGADVAYELSRAGHRDLLTATGTFRPPLTVVYQAGYPSAAAVPPMVRLGILCVVGTMYEARESTTDKARVEVPHSAAAFFRIRGRTVGVG